MKKQYNKQIRSLGKLFLTAALGLWASATLSAQGEDPANKMYGDTIFWEDFGTGSATDLAGLGGIATFGDDYVYNATCPKTSPQYSITNSTGTFCSDMSFLGWLGMGDHTGLVDRKTSPIAVDAARNDNNGRMMYIDLTDNRKFVYKRHVPELCRATEFEFTAWVASVHGNNNNTKFTLEIWDKDPGNYEPASEGARPSVNGLYGANNAKLIAATDGITTLDDSGKWYQLRIIFTLVGQDDCWLVLRNYGGSSGNDIVLDDICFRPYAPFDLNLAMPGNATDIACNYGLVTLYAAFPANTKLPEGVEISSYGFLFEGLDIRTGEWERLGTRPIQVQTTNEPFEITIPVTEYNYYSTFRIAVASTPAGFGGKCVTFNVLPYPAPTLGTTPQFQLSGEDICVPADEHGALIDPIREGTFYITHTNQQNCGPWQVKVRVKENGEWVVKTLQAKPKEEACVAP